MQADTIANAAERAGKKVASIDWVGGAAAGIAGPVVDFTNFFSNRGVLVGVDEQRSEHDGLERSSASTTRSRRSPNASGWTDVPTGDPAATPKQTTWLIRSTFAAQNPNRTYNVYFYDSVDGRRREVRPRDRQPGRQDRRGAVDRRSRSATSCRSS